MENKELIADALIAILKDGGMVVTVSNRGLGYGLENIDDLIDAYGLLRERGEIDVLELECRIEAREAADVRPEEIDKEL